MEPNKNLVINRARLTVALTGGGGGIGIGTFARTAKCLTSNPWLRFKTPEYKLLNKTNGIRLPKIKQCKDVIKTRTASPTQSLLWSNI